MNPEKQKMIDNKFEAEWLSGATSRVFASLSTRNDPPEFYKAVAHVAYNAALPALLEEVEKGPKWIPVTETPAHGRYQVWIPNKSPRGGYYDTALYGTYICEREDVKPGDKGYIEDNDEGNFRSEECWYRIEDTNGGGYDYVYVEVKPTHWMPLPSAPASDDAREVKADG